MNGNHINWAEFDTKGRTTGIMKLKCPACSHTRKKKSDPCFSIDLDKGTGKCWNADCDATTTRFTKRSEPTYTVPPQDWKNRTNLDDKVVKWFQGRGISQTTLTEMKVTNREFKGSFNIEFNYFIGDKLVNVKSRTGDKRFFQKQGAEKTLYNVNALLDGCDGEIIVVEGEIDALTFIECGFKNVVSVPNGSQDVNDMFNKYFDYLMNEKLMILIAVDTDDAGTKCENDLIRRFGKHRCKRIRFGDDCKDANDVLQKYGKPELLECIANATEYPLDGVYDINDVWDGFVDVCENGLEKGITIKHPSFAEFNELFSFVTGQLTMVTGIPSHGKTNWLEFYIERLMLENPDINGGWYSPENFPLKQHQALLAEKIIGKQPKQMTSSDLSQYRDWSSGRIWLTHPQEEQPTWDWIFAKMREMIARYGIKFFVIDAFNKVYLDLNGKTETQAINDLLSKITLFKQQHDIHIFLVAHPTKIRKDESNIHLVPTMYDINGSSHFYNQTDNGLTVYRNFGDPDGGAPDSTDVHVQKVKFKHLGAIGVSEWQYNTNNGRYRRFGGHWDNENWLGKSETQMKIEPSDEWDEPF